MNCTRAEALVSRLRRGAERSRKALDSMSEGQWGQVVYAGPPQWTVRDTVAHLLSAEDGLRRLAADVAEGGGGAPPGLHHDELNLSEQARLAGIPMSQLADDLAASRQTTIAWASTLSDMELDREGLHPALGQISVEEHVRAMCGHEMMHLRDLRRMQRG